MSAEVRDDLLWGSIARSIYTGVAAYAVVILVAFLRDFCRTGASSSTRPQSLVARFYYRFVARYHDTLVFFYVEVIRLIGNLTVCAIYVACTYLQDVPVWASTFYRIFASLMLVDTFLFIFASESAISVVFQTIVAIDALTFPSLILSASSKDYLNFAFLRAISAFDVYARFERRVFVNTFSQSRLLIKLCFKSLSLFYTLSCSIMLLEVPGDLLSVQFRNRWSEFGDWNFINSLYFIVVTLSTVGYGDFSPRTIQGRLYALFIIIVGIIVFTSVVSELVTQANRERGSGYFMKSSRTRHVIVTGKPTLTDLVHFVSEFYSDSRRSNENAKIVVLVEDAPWTDSEWYQYIARNQFLQARLQFLSGSAASSVDLNRARISTADAVFILTSPSIMNDPSVQDTGTVIIVLAVRNMRDDIPIYAQTLLEDSNLQTRVALSTLSSTSGYDSSEREKVARYNGIYESVVSHELKNTPKLFQRLPRRFFQHVLMGHKNRHEDPQKDETSNRITNALVLSQHVCLEEIQMALISGNIRANGVGTLLSNMYLDVQTAKPTPDEPGWLNEYQMGAATNLVYCIVPEELDGVTIKEIAGDLYQGGLVVVASTDPISKCPIPLMTTQEQLIGGDLIMVLSFYESEYVYSAFLLVAYHYVRGEQRHPPEEPNANDSLVGGIFGAGSQPASLISPQSVGLTPRTLNALTLSDSADDLEALAMHGGIDRRERVRSPKEKRSDGYIPDRLKGHVIVAMEGNTPLKSLPLLLKNLWHRDKRKALEGVRSARVVVIHPSISNEHRIRFHKFEHDLLFFVEGSPASRAAWRRARLNTAKAVATVADITLPAEISDARTIFTLLTLDVSTANDQDLFICSELVDEKSLEYLREPIHARRRGANLGEPSERNLSMFAEPSSLIIPTETAKTSAGGDASLSAEGVPGGSPHSRETPVSPFRPSSDNGSSPGQGRHGALGEGSRNNRERVIKFADRVDVVAEREVSLRMESSQSHTPSSPGVPLSKLGSKAKKTGKAMMRLPSSRVHPQNQLPENMTLAVNLGADIPVPGDLSNGGDPTTRPGAARARRGTLFARSRYASGELLVQSSAITLLAREYIEPGFVSFFTNLLGTNTSCPGMKIRLVRIPKSMFNPKKGYTCPKGRPLIRFIDVFLTLVSVGVTPLGIYRSGNAPVLIPFKQRSKRGNAIVKELGPLLEDRAQQTNFRDYEDKAPLRSSRSFGGMGKRVLNMLRDVDPSVQRENLARQEIHGVHNLFEIGDDDDDDDDDDDELIAPDDGDEVAVRNEPNSTYFRKFSTAPVSSRDDAGMEDETSESPQQERNDASFRRWGTFSMFRKQQQEQGSDVPDAEALSKTVYIPKSGKYTERQVAGNLLPYVYTFPDPNTWCAETDGIYILCDSSFELPNKWEETLDDAPPTTMGDAGSSRPT